MNIIIAGGGEIGRFLCESFAHQNNNLVLIERDRDIASELNDKLSARVIHGDFCDVDVLKNAGIEKCDFFISSSTNYYANVVSSSIAKKLGAKKTIARVHATLNNHRLFHCKSFGIDFFIHPETLCAVEIAKVIRNPGRVAVENFALGQIEVQHFFVEPNSKFIGKCLVDLKLDPEIRILYIKNKDNTHIPTRDSIFNANDQLTVVGKHEKIDQLKQSISASYKDDDVYVGIFSVSEISIALMKLLHDKKYKIKIIEQDRAKCEMVAKMFHNVSVINGDSSSIELLREEGFGRVDFFVACSSDDEVNTMTAIQAKHIGAKYVSLALNEGDYESVLDNIKDRIGIDQIVSRRAATANDSFSYVSDKPYTELVALNDQNLVFNKFVIKSSNKVINRSVKTLGLPKGSLLVSLMRDFIADVPKADDILQVNDEVITLSSRDKVQELCNILI